MVETSMLDYAIVAAIIVFAIAIFYRALKEPADQVLNWIKGLFGLIGSGSEKTVEVITYQ